MPRKLSVNQIVASRYNNKTSYYFDRELGTCKEMGFQVGILTPDWLANGNLSGHRDCGHTQGSCMDQERGVHQILGGHPNWIACKYASLQLCSCPAHRRGCLTM